MDYKAMGARIRALRRYREYTQAELANLANISTPFLGHIERGSRKASLETLCRIADALECGVDELLGRPISHSDISDRAHRLLRAIEQILAEE